MRNDGNPAANYAAMTSNRHRRILVVDDSEVTLEVITAQLGELGFEVAVASSGEDALRLLARDTFDLVLLDLVMPGIGGLATLHRIRESHSADSLPVFIVTANDSFDDVRRAMMAGADDFLVKPLTRGAGLAKIAAALEGIGSDQEAERVEIGSTLRSKYRLDEFLGSGGFGSVYRARHLGLDTDVALKVLHGHRFIDAAPRRRLQREGKVLARLDHPNTVRVWDLDTTRDPPFLVMDLLDGHDLSAEILRRGALSRRLAIRIGLQIASGLRAAHRLDIRHRDIKPENVFLHKTENGFCVRLLDFGLASLADEFMEERRLTRDGEIMGSPRYLAPEQVLGLPTSDRTDIYSAGIVLFEMLTGEFPYSIKSDTLTTLILAHSSGTPRRLEAVCGRAFGQIEDVIGAMLARKAGDRPSAERLIQLLSTVLAELEPSERDPEPYTEPFDLTAL